MATCSSSNYVPNSKKPKTKQRKRVYHSCQLDLLQDVYALWCSFGSEKQLATDTEIAKFLLHYYRDTCALHMQSLPSLCINCKSAEPLFCSRCCLQSETVSQQESTKYLFCTLPACGSFRETITPPLKEETDYMLRDCGSFTETITSPLKQETDCMLPCCGSFTEAIIPPKEEAGVPVPEEKPNAPHSEEEQMVKVKIEPQEESRKSSTIFYYTKGSEIKSEIVDCNHPTFKSEAQDLLQGRDNSKEASESDHLDNKCEKLFPPRQIPSQRFMNISKIENTDSQTIFHADLTEQSGQALSTGSQCLGADILPRFQHRQHSGTGHFGAECLGPKVAVADYVVSTKRGKQKLLFEGFSYIFDKFSADRSRKFWRCEQKNECKARLHTSVCNNHVLQQLHQHNHGRDVAPTEVPKIMDRIR